MGDVQEVVVVIVDVGLVVSRLRSLDGFSLCVSRLGLIDIALSDGSVSLVWVHGVRSEVASGSVDPVLVRNVGNVSSGVVGGLLHGSSVDVVLNSDDLGHGSSLLLKLVEGPVGANVDDFVLFLFALGSSVHPLASSEGLKGSNARSGQLVSTHSDKSVLAWGKLDILERSIGSLVARQGVVVSGEHLAPEDSIWVNIGRVELVSPSESEGHSVLRRDLSEGEWVESRNGSSEVAQDGVK